MFIQKLAIISSLIFLTACVQKPVDTLTKSVTDISEIKGLEGCSFYTLSPKDTPVMYVVRCKNSSSEVLSHSSGKTRYQVNLIDDASSIDEASERLKCE